MTGILSLLIVVAISLLIVRIGTVAFTLTGLSRDVAAFQAQSAFSGVGFTTEESETIVSHPLRRRIARILMLMGTAGVTSAVATLVVTFMQSERQTELFQRLGVVALGLGGLFALSQLRLFNQALNWLILKGLSATTGLRLKDYEALLHVGEGYSVAQIQVNEGTWLSGKTLRTLNLTAEGILVLGIRRHREHVFAIPHPDASLRSEDVLICYGFENSIGSLATRPTDEAGEAQHRAAVERWQKESALEIALDREAMSRSEFETQVMEPKTDLGDEEGGAT